VPWFRLIAALVLAASVEAIPLLLSASWLQNAIEMSLALAAISLAGLPVHIKGLAALRQGRLNINAFMTVAVSGAFLIGHWPEAGMVMALYALAEALEARAADRARSAISQLMQLAPEQALVEHPSGQWHRMDVAAVAVGQAVRVEPGDRIPLDGVVASGGSAVNQAPVTGESLPVEKGPGDVVFAGSDTALALGIKAVFLLLTLLGTATMWQAVFADMGTSLLVIAKGMRLLNGLEPVTRATALHWHARSCPSSPG